MRILDIHGNEIISPDLSKGYLAIEQVVVKHHEAVSEQSHEEVKEYPNGGKSIRKVIDVYPVDAWNEYEDVQRYYEYTEAEIAERNSVVTWAELAAALSEGVNSV